MEMYVTFIIVSVAHVVLADETKIIEYFNSDTFHTIQGRWQTERKSFENALILVLQQDYSHEAMNVYVRGLPDSQKISDGFYFSDNVVDLVLLETRLLRLPIMIAPDVTFALASNYLRIEAGLGRMILNTNYLLMRNQSDVVFAASEQNPNKKSPFTFQQVQDSGELTIIAQDCSIVGYAISSLVANTVNLGLDTFKVTNCKFSVEIYSSGEGSPPVFGSYFSEKQSLALQTMISNPIRAKLMPKLQSAIFTYINTSAIFKDKLPQLRLNQNTIFKQTSNYMNGIVGKFVQNTIKTNQGILQLKPLELLWNKTCPEGTCGSCVRLKDVVLYGLDTAYSAHIGGAFKLQSTKVAEAIRFSTMQVRGKIDFENTTINGDHDFSVELKDVAVNIEMEANGGSFALLPNKISFNGWRRLEFSILEMQKHANERRASQSFITGYLVNEIPKRLIDHISKTLGSDSNNNEHYENESDSNKVIDYPQYNENEKNQKQKKKNDVDVDSQETYQEYDMNDRSLEYETKDTEKNSHHSDNGDHEHELYYNDEGSAKDEKDNNSPHHELGLPLGEQSYSEEETKEIQKISYNSNDPDHERGLPLGDQSSSEDETKETQKLSHNSNSPDHDRGLPLGDQSSSEDETKETQKISHYSNSAHNEHGWGSLKGSWG